MEVRIEVTFSEWREGSHVISEMERGKGFGLLAGSPTSLSGGYMSPFALWKLTNF